MKMLVSPDWLRNKIDSDPHLPVEAGISNSPRIGVAWWDFNGYMRIEVINLFRIHYPRFDYCYVNYIAPLKDEARLATMLEF